ncbi:MAG: ribonuclease HII [Candidatus Solibacter usitatus]|nr:ribonuclease HII [Candidatus Solibacter usitatus]
MGAPAAKKDCLRSTYERRVRQQGFQCIAGADEAGRGSLFGPVFAAAVVLDFAVPIRGLRDSKQLTPERREVLSARIRQRARCWAVATADASEIDRINIYQASRLAILRAVQKLNPPPDYLLIDALEIDLPIPQRGIIRGDSLCPSIAAASILAKVDRDACMREMDALYPQYGLARHKGYPTPDHIDALAEFGPTPLHRMSYAPVRQLPLFGREQ